jgi:hypothetical protein
MTADNRLTCRRILTPFKVMLKEIENGNRKVLVGRQLARTTCNDPVPAMVGVTSEGDVGCI